MNVVFAVSSSSRCSTEHCLRRLRSTPAARPRATTNPPVICRGTSPAPPVPQKPPPSWRSRTTCPHPPSHPCPPVCTRAPHPHRQASATSSSRSPRPTTTMTPSEARTAHLPGYLLILRESVINLSLRRIQRIVYRALSKAKDLRIPRPKL